MPAGGVLRSGRDLADLRRTLGARPHGCVQAEPGDAWQRSGVRRWDFGPIPPELSIASGTVRLGVYPTVQDEGDSVRLALHLDATSCPGA